MQRVAVVTGGASGIGRAICDRLADQDCRVGVLDIDPDGAAKAAGELRERGIDAVGCAVDVADRTSVDDAIAKVRADLGAVGIMVTSAGISPFADFTETTIDMWERVLAVNLTGTFHSIQAAVPDMLESGWGRIVTISSSSGQTGPPRLAAYGASKGGVIALTKVLAREYGPHGITANTIPPFLVETPMSAGARDSGDLLSAEVIAQRIPVGRPGTPDDIAATCAFLCSDDASYITGQVIAPNGGGLI